MTIALVGVGPGDPGDVTRRAADLLADAAVVVHDAAPAPVVDALASARAARVDATDPAAIAAGLLQDESGSVVWAVAGDVLADGRLVAVIESLERAGRTYELVSGVADGSARLAAAGVMPAATEPIVDVGAPAAVVPGPPAVLAAAATPGIADRLSAAGWPHDTPVTVIIAGASPDQRCHDVSLADLAPTLDALGAADSPDAGDAAEVVVAVGGRRPRSSWFEQRPLFGRTVLVTRATDQAGSLSRLLAAGGAVPIEVPTIRIVEPADGGAGLGAALGRAGSYDWLVCTSPNGARRVLAGLPDARALGGVRVAVIGPGTGAVFEAGNIVPDLVPERFVAEGLLDVFPPAGPEGGTVLLARAAVARDVLPDGLAGLGWQVDVVEAYRTLAAVPDDAQRRRIASADMATFTSSSTVERFVELYGLDAVPPVVVCIGPVTAATARRLGVRVDVEATEHTIAGLVEAASNAPRFSS
ncbi:MAG: uroporphyrinogen-III synthase [Acidimicrobiales bacterium]|nr:uroporphyrinogen-III synthase [Acidimicrobiales bacterium]